LWCSTPSPCFSHFCPNAPCKYTPLLNFCSLIFSLTPFGWLSSITPIPYLWWAYQSWFIPTFSGMQLGHKVRTACTPTCWFVLYFQNLIQFHSIHVNIILFTTKKCTDLPCQLPQNTKMLNNTTRRPLKPNFTLTGQKILEILKEIHLSLQVQHDCNSTTFHEIHTFLTSCYKKRLYWSHKKSDEQYSQCY